MDVEDEVMEIAGSSLLIDSLAPSQSGEMLSAEDKAWIDSCLINEPEISDSSWNSLKDALLDIFSSQTESISSYVDVNDGFAEESSNQIQISTSSNETETESFSGTTLAFSSGTPNTSFAMDKEVETDELKLNDNVSIFPLLRSPFLPSYSEDPKETEAGVIGPENSLVYEVEQSSGNIFKIWDLDIPGEEDDLGKQLNRVLEESSIQVRPISQNVNDSGMWKDMKEDSIDDVIAGIAGLCLIEIST